MLCGLHVASSKALTKMKNQGKLALGVIEVHFWLNSKSFQNDWCLCL